LGWREVVNYKPSLIRHAREKVTIGPHYPKPGLSGPFFNRAKAAMHWIASDCYRFNAFMTAISCRRIGLHDWRLISTRFQVIRNARLKGATTQMTQNPFWLSN
jgi:hypothetical protein